MITLAGISVQYAGLFGLTNIKNTMENKKIKKIVDNEITIERRMLLLDIAQGVNETRLTTIFNEIMDNPLAAAELERKCKKAVASAIVKRLGTDEAIYLSDFLIVKP